MGPVELHQPSPHVETAGAHKPSLLKQRQIGGAAADVHVQQRLPVALLQGACPLGRQHAFQMGARRCHHKVPGQIRQRPKHLTGVLLSGCLTGDDHRSGVHLIPTDAGLFVLLRHQSPQRLSVHQLPGQQRGQMHRTFVEDPPLRDGQLRHGEGSGTVLHLQL